jgi:hypothetical protein
MRRYFVLKSSSRSLVPVIVMLLSAIPFYYCDGIVINIAYMALAIGAIIAACNKELRDLLLSKFSK